MAVGEAALHEVGVAVTHALVGIVVGAAEGHGQKGLLFGRLAIHIHILEKIADTVVGEYLAVENIDGGIDGGFTADTVIEALGHGVVSLRSVACRHKKDVHEMYYFGRRR